MARSFTRRFIGLVPALALAAATSFGGSGCVMSPRAAESVANLATAALWTAAVVGEIALLSSHDGHYHSDHCGHYRRWYDGRWVYYYGGHWEYYDSRGSGWYYYAE